MNTYILNTSLLNELCVGMYHSFIDPDFTIIDEDFDWDNFSFDKYKSFVADEFNNALDNADSIEYEGLFVKLSPIDNATIDSPREYNFLTDTIEFNVTIDNKQVLTFAKNNKQQFNEYLNENYSSCSGFISFTPNNYNDWLNDFNNEKVQAISAVLNFWNDYYSEMFNDIQSEFVEHVQENAINEEFIN